ncbi:hypothetical protein [Desertibacillus haloalkaliphilus]|uniref:hypothetical protein n=1 Tax=Desertibacillus haloalkaliphilus TaxID=1328930 RepID=UPI001C25E54F|nr:hypothetical protein [Desertibacillus haloalkaliphilus]MBU8905425.1 hypothetical protein [Desertibacillus haloalkaliphilus]
MMMNIVTITADNWEKYRRPIWQFVKRYQQENANSDSSRWLFQLRRHHFNRPGTSIKLVLWDGKMIALMACSNYGTTNSTFIVHPTYQRTHIVLNILKEMKEELGVCYTKIKYDHIHIVKMALQAGFAAIGYADSHEKVSLWFAGGHWHKNDIFERELSVE